MKPLKSYEARKETMQHCALSNIEEYIRRFSQNSDINKTKEFGVRACCRQIMTSCMYPYLACTMFP